jgi:hypothetical protein
LRLKLSPWPAMSKLRQSMLNKNYSMFWS